MNRIEESSNNSSNEICKNLFTQFVKGQPPTNSSESVFTPNKPSSKFIDSPNLNQYPFSTLAQVKILSSTLSDKTFELTGILVGPSQLLVQLDSDQINPENVSVKIGGDDITISAIFRSKFLALNRFCVLELTQQIGFQRGYVGLLAQKRAFNPGYYFGLDIIENQQDEIQKKRGIIVCGFAENTVKFLHSNIVDITGGNILHLSLDKKNEELDFIQARLPMLVNDQEAGFAVIGFSSSFNSKSMKGLIFNSEQFNQVCLFSKGLQAPDILRIPYGAIMSDGQHKVEMKQIKGHRNEIRGIYRLNYRLVASIDNQNSIKIWQTETKKLYYEIQLSSKCSCMRVEGTNLYACIEGKIEVWDWSERKQIGEYIYSGKITHLIEVSENHLIIAEKEGIINIFREGREVVRNLNQQTKDGQMITNMTLVDDKQVAVGYGNSQIILYDWTNGKVLKKLDDNSSDKVNMDKSIMCMVMMKSLSLLICGYGDGQLITRSTKEDFKVQKKFKYDNQINAINILNEKEIIVCSGSQTAVLNLQNDMQFNMSQVNELQSQKITGCSVIDCQQFVTSDIGGYIHFWKVDQIFDEIYLTISEQDLLSLQHTSDYENCQSNLLAMSRQQNQISSSEKENSKQQIQATNIQKNELGMVTLLKEKDQRIHELMQSTIILQQNLASQSQELHSRINYQAQLELHIKELSNKNDTTCQEDIETSRIQMTFNAYQQEQIVEDSAQQLSEKQMILDQLQTARSQMSLNSSYQEIQSEDSYLQYEQQLRMQDQMFIQQVLLSQQLTKEKDSMLKLIVKINTSSNRLSEENQRLINQIVQKEAQCAQMYQDLMEKAVLIQSMTNKLQEFQAKQDNTEIIENELLKLQQLFQEQQKRNQSLRIEKQKLRIEWDREKIQFENSKFQSAKEKDLLQNIINDLKMQLNSYIISPSQTINKKSSSVSSRIQSSLLNQNYFAASQKPSDSPQTNKYDSKPPLISHSYLNLGNLDGNSNKESNKYPSKSKEPQTERSTKEIMQQRERRTNCDEDKEVSSLKKNEFSSINFQNNNNTNNHSSNKYKGISPSRTSPSYLRGFRNEIQKVQEEINILKNQMKDQERKQFETTQHDNYFDPPQEFDSISHEENQANIQSQFTNKFQELSHEKIKKNNRITSQKNQYNLNQNQYDTPQRVGAQSAFLIQNGNNIKSYSPISSGKDKQQRYQKCNIQIQISPRSKAQILYI